MNWLYESPFARAAAFFPTHFPDRPVTDFWCRSWLLDPALAAALDPASNMARFQARWRLYGEPMPGDEDALFFTFARRGEVDLATLPRQHLGRPGPAGRGPRRRAQAGDRTGDRGRVREVDLATLPRDTTLQRVVADRLRAGGHWAVRTGRLPLTTIGERA